jgi:hypothetical protein
MKKRLLIFIGWMGAISCLFAQNMDSEQLINYQPLDMTVGNLAETVKTLEAKHKKCVNNAPKTHKGEWVELYESRFKDVKQSVEKRYFIFDKKVTTYFDHILQTILKANPQIPLQDIHLFIARYTFPNAMSLGDGTVILNIGLLRRLENESQVAFVICHEIAHFLLDHTNQNIQKRIETAHSKDFQKEVRQINNSEYNQRSRALELLKNITYDHRKHSRTHELEADSLGLVYLKNTGYSLGEAISCLEILDTIDQEKYDTIPDFKQVFDHPQYPFKDSWLASEDSGFEYQKDLPEQWEEDSLKTHPDCQERIAILKPFVAKRENSNPFLQDKKMFEDLVKIFDFETVEADYFFEDYGNCLYKLLLLLRQYPQNAYLQGVLGRCMYAMYEAQQKHELNKYVALQSPHQAVSYRKVLDFIHHLRLSEIANLTYYYMQKNEEVFKNHEDYLFALAMSKKIMSKTDEFNAYKSLYIKQFPKGRYKQQIETLK